MKEVWTKVPESVDILLTHTPPRGHGDKCGEGSRVGCEMLTAAIMQRFIPVNVFGHIHSGYGCSTDDATLYINASTCDSEYRPINPPIVFDVPPPEELRAATRTAVEKRRGPHEEKQAGESAGYQAASKHAVDRSLAMV